MFDDGLSTLDEPDAKKDKLTWDNFENICKEKNIFFLKSCPICGHDLNVCFRNGQARIQCECNDEVHNIFRDKKYFDDPIDCINDWHIYAKKVLTLRKYKKYVMRSYYVATLLPFAGLMVYSFFTPITMFSVVVTLLLMTLPCFVSLKFFSNHLIVINGTKRANQSVGYHEKFLEDFQLIQKSNQQNDFGVSILEKMKNDNNKIKKLQPQIKNKSLSKSLKELVGISQEMYQYLLNHPDNVSLGVTFTNVYQESVLNLTQKYIDTYDRKNHEKSKNLLKDIEDTLSQMQTLYQREYDKITSNYTLDINAELKVLRQEIEAVNND